MDPTINHLHARSHSADLERRAELARLAARARESRSERRPARSLQIPHPGAAVLALLSRPGRTPRRAGA